MKYVIVTTEWLWSKGAVVGSNWRKNVDGSKVILHAEMAKPLLTGVDNLTEYDWDSEEFNAIINSEEWTTT